MAVEGKKAYKFYLDEKNVEFLKSHFASLKDSGGLSGFIDKYLERSVWILKSSPEYVSEIKKHPGKFNFIKLWQLVKLQWNILEEHENCALEKKNEVAQNWLI